MHRWWMACLGLAACKEPVELVPPAQDDLVQMSLGRPVEVHDIAIEAGFQDVGFGEFKRGRACLAADFDNDGWTDVYVGNPEDPSHVLLNVTGEAGRLAFRQGPAVSAAGIYWGGAVGDLDNDGDVDLFVSAGGNEDRKFDELFQNRLVEDGALNLVRVGRQAGVQGPVPEGNDEPIRTASANARMVDVDQDGWLDIFVNSYLLPGRNDPWPGRNLLYRNQRGNGFVEIGAQAGFTTERATMNSVWFDPDLDGDLDLFENNHRDPNAMWRNHLVEEGTVRFTNVTRDESLAGGDMRYPIRSFASAVADFNRDGFEDLFAFVRPVEPESSAFLDGHVLFINDGGNGFVEATGYTGLNQPFVNWFRDHAVDGVMGGQLGDLNVDGIPDVWIGQGRPADGTENLLFMSTGELERVVIDDEHTVVVPRYENLTELIAVAAPEDPTLDLEYPPYPYRTHGTCIVDFDHDGVPELAVTNGGASGWPDVVQEPNRLFQFVYDEPRRWLRVELEGDGRRVNRSGIGARVTLTVHRDSDGASWTHRQWLHGGNGFSAASDLALFFGLGDATRVSELEVSWPDGQVDVYGEQPLDTSVRFER